MGMFAINNMKDKIINFIKTNSYALFIIALILLVIIGLIISSLFKQSPSKRDTTQNSKPAVVDDYTSVTFSPTRKGIPVSNTVKSSLEKNLNFTGISFADQPFTDPDVSTLNNSSYIFSFLNYDPVRLSSLLSISSVSEVSDYALRGLVNNRADFMNDYLNLLNRSFSQEAPLKFTLKRVSEKQINLYEEEFSYPANPADSTHTEHIYSLYLGPYLFVNNYGLSATNITFLENNEDLKSTVTFSKFVPQNITIKNRINFESGNYDLSLIFALDPGFDTYYLNNDFGFVNDGFYLSKGKPTLLYVYDTTSNIAVPFLSKEVTYLYTKDSLNSPYYIFSAL